MGSRAVKRIRDARLIRDHQFKEDGGPAAHPVRPNVYKEINNFYTVTVYHKGAEVIRMMHTRIGAEGFRRGLKRYLERHDGLGDHHRRLRDRDAGRSGHCLEPYRRWYSQAGTPVLHLEDGYREDTKRWSIRVTQELPQTPDGSPKEPLTLPFSIGLLTRDGQAIKPELPRPCEGPEATVMLDVRMADELFVLHGVNSRPVVSGAPRLLRPGQDRAGALGRGPPPPPRPRSRSVRALGRGTDPRPVAPWTA